MAEAEKYVFTYKEIAEALVKKQGITDGHWGIYLEFGIRGTNIETAEELIPAAVIPVTKIGIQRFDKPNALTVDAAQIIADRKSGGQRKK